MAAISPITGNGFTAKPTCSKAAKAAGQNWERNAGIEPALTLAYEAKSDSQPATRNLVLALGVEPRSLAHETSVVPLDQASIL